MSRETKPTGRVRPTREQTREQILAAAATVFASRGYERTSLDDVAAAADLTKGAIYSSFADKQALFVALMTDQVRKRLARMGAEVDVAGTVDELIDSVSRTMTDATFQDSEWHVTFIEFWTHVMRRPDLRAAFAQDRRATHAAVAELLRHQAQASGVTLPMAAERLAVVMLALSNGLAIEQLLEPDGADRQLLADTLRTLLRP